MFQTWSTIEYMKAGYERCTKHRFSFRPCRIYTYESSCKTLTSRSIESMSHTHGNSPLYFHLLYRSDRQKVSYTRHSLLFLPIDNTSTCASLVDLLWVDKHKPTLGVNMMPMIHILHVLIRVCIK